MRNSRSVPGTVSRILWHFTGGPRWNGETGRQERRPKPAAEAFEHFLSILRTKELRVGGYFERFSVVLPHYTYFDWKSRKRVSRRNVEFSVESAKVNCLADIPVAHLAYHAQRYGRFAIGFHRAAVIKHGFNPVLYSLSNAKLINWVDLLGDALNSISLEEACYGAEEIRDLAAKFRRHKKDGVAIVANEIAAEASDLAIALGASHFNQLKAIEGFRNTIAFIKSFSQNEFDSIYCEREWRSLETFRFSYDDVAMVVVPRSRNSTDFFAVLCQKHSQSLGLPRSLPIIAWEDLVEH